MLFGTITMYHQNILVYVVHSIHVEKHVKKATFQGGHVWSQALTPLSSPSSCMEADGGLYQLDHEEALKLDLRHGNRKGQMLSTCQ